MKSRPSRGLQDIRTMTERTRDSSSPQRKYLTLAMLELEKVRRNKERENASRRVESIDRRVAEIDQQQADLLGTVEVERADFSPANGSGAPGDADSRPDQGFNLTY